MSNQFDTTDLTGIVVYVRYSSERQTNSSRIEAQKQAMRTALKRLGLLEVSVVAYDEQSEKGI